MTKPKARMTKRPAPAERLKAALEEGIRQVRGELTLRTVQVPERPTKISTAGVARLREKR